MNESQNDFFECVWEVVAPIPPGTVATYGDIAGHLGARSAARTGEQSGAAHDIGRFPPLVH